MSSKIRLESTIIDKAFNKNIISVEVRPAYIGRNASIYIDTDTVFARAYLKARKEYQKMSIL